LTIQSVSVDVDCAMTEKTSYLGIRRTISRQALLDAAERLFASREPGAVSIDEIVAMAGVAKGTFYNHFKDKHDISNHVALTIRHEIRDRIADAKIVSKDPAVHLAIAHALFMHMAVVNPSRGSILITMLAGASNLDAPMNARVRMTLEQGLSSGRLTFGSLQGALSFVLGVVYAGIRGVMETSASERQREYVSELITLSLTGLGLARSEADEIARNAIAGVFVLESQ
jgi:AcrR family transcriptional regulator